MQYNESQYDGDSYNLTNYTATLSETVTDTDATVAFSMGIVKTDSQGSADAISDGVSLAAMLDTVTIYQRAHTPFAYNNGRYNDFMYNTRADEDEILLMAIKALSDGMSVSDATSEFVIDKLLVEMFSETDTVSFSNDVFYLDFIFLSEFLAVSITNKALNDTLLLSDWLSIKQNPQSVEWFD